MTFNPRIAERKAKQLEKEADLWASRGLHFNADMKRNAAARIRASIGMLVVDARPVEPMKDG